MMAAAREIRIELLLGRTVVDAEGRRIGRIEEFCARRDGDRCHITEYMLGPVGLLERLSVSSMGAWLLRRIGMWREPQRIPWDALDLADPQHPRLKRGPAADARVAPRDAHQRDRVTV